MYPWIVSALTVHSISRQNIGCKQVAGARADLWFVNISGYLDWEDVSPDVRANHVLHNFPIFIVGHHRTVLSGWTSNIPSLPCSSWKRHRSWALLVQELKTLATCKSMDQQLLEEAWITDSTGPGRELSCLEETWSTDPAAPGRGMMEPSFQCHNAPETK